MNDYNTVVMCNIDVPRKNQYGFKQGAIESKGKVSPQLTLAFDQTPRKYCTGVLCGHYNSHRLPKMAHMSLYHHTKPLKNARQNTG